MNFYEIVNDYNHNAFAKSIQLFSELEKIIQEVIYNTNEKGLFCFYNCIFNLELCVTPETVKFCSDTLYQNLFRIK